MDKYRGKHKNTYTSVQQKDKSKGKGNFCCSCCEKDKHSDERCWKVHSDLAPSWSKKKNDENNTFMSKGKKINGVSDSDEKLSCVVQKEICVMGESSKEEDVLTKQFHIKIQIKDKKVDSLFDAHKLI